jgi:predicted transcriptional regulator of viral defense system
MGARSSTVEHVAARFADRAHGVVTRAELLSAGVSRREIAGRLRSGALLREYPGVYRVGHRAPSVEARYMAAVRACGDGARLYGPAAAHLLSIGKGPPPPPEVVVPTPRRVKGIRIHRSRHPLPGGEATTWRGIPVTTPARTLVDLAAVLSEDELARACHEAAIRHHTTPAQVDAVLARRPNSPGAAKLRGVLRGEVRVALSRLERRFLDRIRRAGLPLPITNHLAGGRLVDCRWPSHRLTVELDGYRYHHSRHAWEQDRRREREAYSRGDQFRRYTYGDVLERPEPMMGELRGLLGRPSPGP